LGRGGTGAVADHGQVSADLDRLVLLDEDLLEDAGDGRGDLGVDLVRGDLEQRLVDRDLVTHALEPAGHSPFGHGLAKGRHGHAFGHRVAPYYGVEITVWRLRVETAGWAVQVWSTSC